MCLGLLVILGSIVLWRGDYFYQEGIYRSWVPTQLPIRVLRMFLTIACGILSFMVGIPRGRFLLLVLGMYTPFVGCVFGISH